jgi:thioredoxin reductase (NADPH)
MSHQLMRNKKMEEVQSVVIIGSGPAGYTAAIYAARANMKPVLFEGFYSGPAGGQLMTTTEVENYPGFPEGISGPDLMEAMKKQAVRFGTKVLREDVKDVDLSQRPFTIKGSKTTLKSHTIIVATGATAKRLDIEGTRDGEFWQQGVTACAVCDGAMPIFRDKDLYVVGGGDTAMEEALFLTKFGKRVFIVHRRNEFRASKIMGERVLSHPKISVLWNHVVVKVEGSNVVESVTVEDLITKKQEKREAAGLFFAIGHEPNTKFFKGQLMVNDHGYLVTKDALSLTSCEGVFGAGDVHDLRYRQAVTAAGAGCKAALDAERYLVEKGISH